ncbi:MAG: hypothetical protein MHPSP_000547, partial [Paramarteilia canceri]
QIAVFDFIEGPGRFKLLRDEICPRGYYRNPIDNICKKCEGGRTSDPHNSFKISYICRYCLDGWINTNKETFLPSCAKCPDNQIAGYDKYSDDNRECYEHNCGLSQFFDTQKRTCVECSEKLENSIGRDNDPGSLPLWYKCKCPVGQLKVYRYYPHTEVKLMCLHENDESELGKFTYEDVVQTISSRDESAKYFKLLYVFADQVLLFKICDPKEERNNNEHVCLCEKNYVYNNGRCVPYVE